LRSRCRFRPSRAGRHPRAHRRRQPDLHGARRDIVARVAARGWPAIYDQRDYVDAGGLMSYGGTLAGAYRQAADYAAAILRGAKPGDLPCSNRRRSGSS
jgi:ABC-type uncharacterized transport system substrate-binding protein